MARGNYVYVSFHNDPKRKTKYSVMGTNALTGLPAHLTIEYDFNIGLNLGKEENVPLTGTVIRDGVLYMFDSKQTNPPPTFAAVYNNHVLTCDGQTGFIRALSDSFEEILYVEPMVDNDSQLSSFTKRIDDPSGAVVRMFRVNGNLFSYHFNSNSFSISIKSLSNGNIGSEIANISGNYSQVLVIGNSVLFQDSY